MCSAVQVLAVCSYHISLLEAAEVEEVRRPMKLVVELLRVCQLDLVLHVGIMVYTWTTSHSPVSIPLQVMYTVYLHHQQLFSSPLLVDPTVTKPYKLLWFLDAAIKSHDFTHRFILCH